MPRRYSAAIVTSAKGERPPRAPPAAAAPPVVAALPFAAAPPVAAPPAAAAPPATSPSSTDILPDLTPQETWTLSTQGENNDTQGIWFGQPTTSAKFERRELTDEYLRDHLLTGAPHYLEALEAAAGHLFYQGLAVVIFLAQACVFPSRRGARILLALATAACAANVAVYAVLGFQLQGIENELVSAADLVAGYSVYLAAFAVLAASALALAWCTAIKRERHQSPAPLAVASILAFVAIFLMRFTFYMSHLTVGLGV